MHNVLITTRYTYYVKHALPLVRNDILYRLGPFDRMDFVEGNIDVIEIPNREVVELLGLMEKRKIPIPFFDIQGHVLIQKAESRKQKSRKAKKQKSRKQNSRKNGESKNAQKNQNANKKRERRFLAFLVEQQQQKEAMVIHLLLMCVHGDRRCAAL